MLTAFVFHVLPGRVARFVQGCADIVSEARALRQKTARTYRVTFED